MEHKVFLNKKLMELGYYSQIVKNVKETKLKATIEGISWDTGLPSPSKT
jgi:hypothetical protein